MITVKHLYKEFENNDGTRSEILKDINLNIEQGEKIVVVGPSGSGKSTMLRCLNLLEIPTKGEIFLDGVKINDPSTNINKIRQKMGMVFQSFNLFNNLTVMENLTLAPVKLK
ncbi:MAG: amino acid ABC transporter ATP-binding protein, partial [Lachnospiraceae bacterium]|nr:amino acid ABC transporter ATP-binding protein [Lachnospiraceae bacterium]